MSEIKPIHCGPVDPALLNFVITSLFHSISAYLALQQDLLGQNPLEVPLLRHLKGKVGTTEWRNQELHRSEHRSTLRSFALVSGCSGASLETLTT